MPRNCFKCAQMASRSSMVPPQGGFVKSSSLLAEMVSRRSFAQMEKGKLSGAVRLLTKSAKTAGEVEGSYGGGQSGDELEIFSI